MQFFGTSVASFADGVRTQDGDVFEIEIPEFGQPLVNAITRVEPQFGIGAVVAL